MRRDPFATKYDVCVVGAGFAGVAAALAAARAGKRTVIVEWRAQLGWEASSAYHLDIGEGESEAMNRIFARALHMDGCRDGRIDGPIPELVIDELLAEAGVDVLLYCRATRLLTDGGHAAGVVVGNKSGEQVIQARIVVDATEEGFLWRQAGAAFAPVSPPPGRQTLFLNGTRLGLSEPMNIGDAGEATNITLKPMPWPAEVCVEFDVPECSVATGRCAMPCKRTAATSLTRSMCPISPPRRTRIRP